MLRAEQISRRLKLRQLNILVAVVRWGSMARAAEHLAISQPVVSKAIADLENTLGVRLLDRSPQGVEPTLYGSALLKRSVAIFDDLRTSVSEIEFLSDPTSGELRVGSVEAMGAGLLPTIIDRLARQYPRLAFDVVQADPTTLRDSALRGRRVDLVMGPFATQDLEEDLEATILFHDRLCVVAGVSSRWAGRRKITPADLVNERWCLPASDHPAQSALIDGFRRCGLEPPQSIVTVTSAQFTTNLVAKGQFLGVLSTGLLDFNPPSVPLKVLAVDLQIRDWSPISIITLKNRTLSPVAQLFIDSAREVTKSMRKINKSA
jgi:DNA-binding transcriptional LysR family regulator